MFACRSLDGIQATAQLLDRNDQLKIIMLTTFDLDEYALMPSTPGPAASPKTPRPSNSWPQLTRCITAMR